MNPNIPDEAPMMNVWPDSHWAASGAAIEPVDEESDIADKEEQEAVEIPVDDNFELVKDEETNEPAVDNDDNDEDRELERIELEGELDRWELEGGEAEDELDERALDPVDVDETGGLCGAITLK